MIVKMKRLTLICVASERESTVEAVRELGVVHVVPAQPPAGPPMDDAKAALAEAEKAATVLHSHLAGEDAGSSSTAPMPVDQLIRHVVEQATHRHQLDDSAGALERELIVYAAFGEFDPATIRTLQQEGITVRLGRSLARTAPTAPDGYVVKALGSDEDGMAFAAIADQAFELDDLDLGEGIVSVPLPERSPAETRQLLEDLREETARIDADLASLAASHALVDERIHELTDALRFVSVREGMGTTSELAYVQGYMPADQVECVHQAATEHGWGLIVDDPDADEPVPTLLRYSRLTRPVKAVFEGLSIYPGYREPDVGWVFLPFFSIFFGMLVGDTIYGLLLLGTTVFLNLRFKKIPQHIFNLFYITSGVTIVWGLLNGSYLGIPHIPGFLESLKVGWLGDRNNLIELCFLIGAIHLSVAHIWNIFDARPRTKILAQVGWLLDIWSMFFLARTMVLGHPFPSWGMYTLLGGIVLIAAFMTRPSEFKDEWINHALLVLTIINSFVDVLSYVRLFAVGYAGVAVIEAFNMMASSLGWGNPLTAIAAVFVLIFANALNLVLCALGVLVHAVRLNTLEFSQHKGISWQGFLYNPFTLGKSESATQDAG